MRRVLRSTVSKILRSWQSEQLNLVHLDLFFGASIANAKHSSTCSCEFPSLSLSDCSVILMEHVNNTFCVCVRLRWCSRIVCADVACTCTRPKTILRAMKIVRVYCTSASLSGARGRAPSLVCTWIYVLRLARTFHPHPWPTVDASSCMSRSESSFTLALPSL